MLSFDHPAALAICLVPPVVAVLAAFRAQRRTRALSLPLDVWGGPASADAPAVWRFAIAVSRLCVALAWVVFSVAAAGPASEIPVSSTAKSGFVLVFAVDSSPSMAARDLEPTRLDAAKALVRVYLESPDGAAGAAVGLVAFGAEAALACPPTTDYKVVSDRLEAILPGVLGDGTAIGLGLANALRQVAASGSPRSAVVLLTDGEDNVGLVHPEDAAAAIGRHGTDLMVVGLGSRGDIPIEYIDPASGQKMSGAYRSDFNQASMEALALAGGGEYRSADDPGSLDTLAVRLGALGTLDADGAFALSAPMFPAVRAGTVRVPVGKPLFGLALSLIAAAWIINRLILGGLA